MNMDTVGDALHAYLDQRLEQLDRAYDEAETAYLDLPRKQRSAREEEHHAMFMEWQRRREELSLRAITCFDALDALDELDTSPPFLPRRKNSGKLIQGPWYR